MSDTPSEFNLTAAPEHAGQRLDRFLAGQLPELTRSRLQGLIAQGCLTSAGATIQEASAKVKPGAEYQLVIPPAEPSHMPAQAMVLDIVYEDADMLVINKPAGLTVHPAPGHKDHTLVNALLAHCGESLSGIGGVTRPGIVHRLDKDTSGLMVVAKHDTAHQALAAQLADHTLGRAYTAVVWGVPLPAKGRVEGNIGRSPSNRQKMAVVKSGGKLAVTHYTVQEMFSLNGKPFASLVECRLETGRTHQIRVHMTHIGHPLIGDPVYGQSTSSRLNGLKALPDALRQTLLGFNRQALHAKELRLVHPAQCQSLNYACSIPYDIQQLISILRKA